MSENSKLPESPEDRFERVERLFHEAGIGVYSPGVTAQDLADAKRLSLTLTNVATGKEILPKKGGETALHCAARHNHYPEGTTIKLLAAVLDAEDKTPLYVALKHRHLPEGTTAAELAQASLKGGDGLRWAAHFGTYPKDITVTALANSWCLDRSALHEAADHCHLLEETTIKDLSLARRQGGITALDCLLSNINRLRELDNDLQRRLKSQVPLLLQASERLAGTNVNSKEELEYVGQVFAIIDGASTVGWMAEEMNKHAW